MSPTNIPILDHGYVKYIDHCGSDQSIIEAARMSTNKGFQDWEKDAPLLDYLFRHHHTSPFEMPDLTIEVQAPIMVFREWHRHRTQSYNELSARYTELPNMYYVPSLERIQKQSKKNKQGSDEPYTESQAAEIQNQMLSLQGIIRDQYEWFLREGVAREIARINCPVSQYSRMRAKANLINWIKFLTLRCDEAAQWEIRQYANAVREIVKELFPRTLELFEEHDRNGAKFSRSELEALRDVLDHTPPETIREFAKHRLEGRKLDEFMKKVCA